MNYLVDTHVFLWTVFSPKKISKKAKNILLDPESVKYVSTITFWEISLKFSLGKIDLKHILPDKLSIIAKETGFEFLLLNEHAASTFYKLPKVKHKDPFDRMLAWQAINNDYVLLSNDEEFLDYRRNGLKIVW